MRVLLVVVLMSGLVVGCGDSPADDNQSDVNQNQNDEDDDDDSGWSRVSSLGATGWMELDADLVHDIAEFDDAVGTWIEKGDEEVPAECSGRLEAGEESGGLAVARTNTSEIPEEDDNQQNFENGSNHGSDDSDGDDNQVLPEIDELEARPDVTGEPAPIYATDLRGWVRDFDEDDNFARLLEIQQYGHRPDIQVETCETAFQRGHCYVPSNEFGASGCGAGIDREPDTLDHQTESRVDGDDWVLDAHVYRYCQHGNSRTDSHPEDLEPGHSQVTIHEIEELPRGEIVELEEDDFEWAGSFVESTSEPVENPGGVSCTWDARQIADLERGAVLVEDGEVYLDLRGAGDDAEFFVWGSFELPE